MSTFLIFLALVKTQMSVLPISTKSTEIGTATALQ